MAHEITVPASEFARNFARYQDEAQSGTTVRVTSHGRVVGAWLSTAELEHFRRLKQQERQVHRVGELPDELLAGIEAGEYGIVPR